MKNYKDVAFNFQNFNHKLKKSKFSIKLVINDYGIIKIWLTGSVQLSSFISSVTHSDIASCATFLFLPHFDVICDLLLNRGTATWNLFVKLIE